MTLVECLTALVQAVGVDIQAHAAQLIAYETGSWTPSVQNATGYQARVGRYTRIGNKVFIEGYVRLDSTANGGPVIAGLPFMAQANEPAGGVQIITFNTARAFTAITGQVLPNTTTLQILAATSASTSLATYANTFGKTGSLSFAGHYTAA